jgi:hypothetical protein
MSEETYVMMSLTRSKRVRYPEPSCDHTLLLGYEVRYHAVKAVS